MLIISGVNVFPSQIESLLLDQKEVEPQYVIIVKKKGYLDTLEVHVEAKPDVYDAGAERIKGVEGKIENHMRGMIGIGIKVRLVAPGTITRSEGKAKRVIDERNK
jgi:phenylacetate-CoA ligase